jgi:hypothetical protein
MLMAKVIQETKRYWRRDQEVSKHKKPRLMGLDMRAVSIEVLPKYLVLEVGFVC